MKMVKIRFLISNVSGYQNSVSPGLLIPAASNGVQTSFQCLYISFEFYLLRTHTERWCLKINVVCINQIKITPTIQKLRTLY